MRCSRMVLLGFFQEVRFVPLWNWTRRVVLIDMRVQITYSPPITKLLVLPVFQRNELLNPQFLAAHVSFARSFWFRFQTDSFPILPVTNATKENFLLGLYWWERRGFVFLLYYAFLFVFLTLSTVFVIVCSCTARHTHFLWKSPHPI